MKVSEFQMRNPVKFATVYEGTCALYNWASRAVVAHSYLTTYLTNDSVPFAGARFLQELLPVKVCRPDQQ